MTELPPDKGFVHPRVAAPPVIPDTDITGADGVVLGESERVWLSVNPEALCTDILNAYSVQFFKPVTKIGETFEVPGCHSTHVFEDTSLYQTL